MNHEASEMSTENSVKTGEFDLIRGEFSPEESLEILDYLIDKKINFHQTKIFSQEIRYGEVDEKSKQRCEELKKSKAAVREFIQKAREQGGQLRIKSNLNLEII